VSRRIGENEDRTKLRALARELEQGAGAGLIVRTAGAGSSRRELLRDLRTLQRLWEAIGEQFESASAPALIYAESDLVGRALRDLVDREVEQIHVDTPEAHARAAEMLRAIQPEYVERLKLHDSSVPIFHGFQLETEIDSLRSRKVELPGGGSLVFDSTEALVAVDVNSGRMREEDGLEETALRTNLEAAPEIARQLRLRDLGGVVVVDFIDMRDPQHIKDVERAFRTALRRDRARLRPGRLGAFGIFALTRQRAGAGSADGRRPCARCGGTGEVVRPEEVALRVFREIMARAAGSEAGGLRVRLSPDVAETLRAMRSAALSALSEETGRAIRLEADPELPPGGWRLEAAAAP
jgi:ribonuclease E